MKFSYNWLREFVPALDTPPRDLLRLITMKTAECEGIEQIHGDSVIEVDNKSLTHRPDLWGHDGMAREVAAITQSVALDPVDLSVLPPGASPVKIEIEDLALCPRYSALVFENITVRPSPHWMQQRLEAIGLNPINNIVDVTNLIMAELAQPMHAFDGAKLDGDTIFVRSARYEESITALNEETYPLTPANLVIADRKGAIAIAGVIGGLESAITQSTDRLVLESANFNAASVRKTSAQLKLRTDASMRFEKAQDPVNTVRALARAVDLLTQVSPGLRVVGGVADCAAPLPPQPIIEVSVDWLSSKLGRAVTADQVRSILESLQFTVFETTPNLFSVTVPSWRATKDITVKDDVLEEVGRIIGYDSIPPVAPLVKASVPPSNPEREYHRRIKRLAADEGFTEVSNYSFVSEDMARAFGLNPRDHLTVKNPIASDQALLRTSLLPRIWTNILENSKHLQHFCFFEIGREIHKRLDGLPDEVPHLVAVVFDHEGDGSAGLFEVKRLAQCIVPDCEVTEAQAKPYEHPERAWQVTADSVEIGRIFELHPSLGVEGRAALLDLDLRKTHSLVRETVRYHPLRRYPASAFDLSVVVAAREPVGDIKRRLAAAAGSELLDIEYVRQYTGPPLAAGQKSVSFRMTVGAPDRTLSSEEVGAIRSRIIDTMQAAGYTLRL